jgi:hypothetical protein
MLTVPYQAQGGVGCDRPVPDGPVPRQAGRTDTKR